MLIFRIKSFVNGTIDGMRTTKLNMSFGCIEMAVARNNISGFNQNREKHIFSSASLMSWEEMIKTQNIFERLFHVVITPCSGIRLVASHHSSPLLVAHGTGSGIGK